MSWTIEAASDDHDFALARELITEYLDSLPFNVDFQDVDTELAELQVRYGPPGGRGLIARVDAAAMGFVGIQEFGPGAGELKRMYVRPAARGLGLGRALAVAGVKAARELGYRRLLLDTVASLQEAIHVYESLGFVPIEPYRHNPRPDARYFALDL
jgi:putative acetyltransferase